MFMDGINIVGTGELQTGYRDKNIAYIDIIVSKNYRSKGMGQYITSYLRKTADDSFV